MQAYWYEGYDHENRCGGVQYSMFHALFRRGKKVGIAFVVVVVSALIISSLPENEADQ